MHVTLPVSNGSNTNTLLPPLDRPNGFVATPSIKVAIAAVGALVGTEEAKGLWVKSLSRQIVHPS